LTLAHPNTVNQLIALNMKRFKAACCWKDALSVCLGIYFMFWTSTLYSMTWLLKNGSKTKFSFNLQFCWYF